MLNWRDVLGMLPEPEAAPFPAPVFIVGCMRSGTTFLADKLSRHPQFLKIGSELREVWTKIGGASCIGRKSEGKTAEDADFEAAVNMAHYFSEFIQESKNLRRHLMRAKNAVRGKQGRIFYDWERIRPLNKSTQLINKISYIHRLFPQAQIILIIRELNGQSASMKAFMEHHYQKSGLIHYYPPEMDASWGQIPEKDISPAMKKTELYPENFKLIPSMWIRLNALALRAAGKLPDSAVCVVSYEDLVMDQENQLTKIFQFLNPDPRHSRYEKNISEEKIKVFNTTTQGDPLTKWKRQLDTSEISILEKQKETREYQFIMDELAKRKI